MWPLTITITLTLALTLTLTTHHSPLNLHPHLHPHPHHSPLNLHPHPHPTPNLKQVCVGQLLSYIMNTVEGSTNSAGAHDLNISQREANLFYSNGIGPSAVAAAPAHVLLQRIEKSRARAISDMKLGIRPK